MARVIAAQNERGSRKGIAPLDRQPAIAKEKSPAETLKHGAPGVRRQEHSFRFDLASH
jgi:hypothetical protein